MDACGRLLHYVAEHYAADLLARLVVHYHWEEGLCKSVLRGRYVEEQLRLCVQQRLDVACGVE